MLISAARGCRHPTCAEGHPALALPDESCSFGRALVGIPVATGSSAYRLEGELREEVVIAGSVLVPYTSASVALARQRLASDLVDAGIFDSAVGDVLLVVSELLTNALRHARPLPGANLQVAWAVEDDEVEVAVSDGGAQTRPVPARATVSSLGGRGLGIVEYLARNWGVRDDDTGLTVWAILEAPAQQNAAAAAGFPRVADRNRVRKDGPER